MAKLATAQSDVENIGLAIAGYQNDTARKLKRMSVLITEYDKLKSEVETNRINHATLLRKFDAAAALP